MSSAPSGAGARSVGRRQEEIPGKGRRRQWASPGTYVAAVDTVGTVGTVGTLVTEVKSVVSLGT